MDKTYNPASIESKWYQQWESNNYFAPSGEGKPYCIMIPPPNVTGILHMGHGFQSALQDSLTRYHRMKGNNTLWQVGCDHAGIATQMVVERKLLNEEGIKRTDMGRDAFVDKVWEWKEQSGNTITQQFRRLGISVDWSRERFTMDEGLCNAVSEVFIRLYEEGLIYRGKRLVNWDPKLHTAISDLEVVSEDKEGKLWHFRYPLASGKGHVVIATTRPETLLGDSAVAVHPDDERYQDLVGQMVKLPLCDREIPIIADDYVDPEFGTGCVKITPAHDFNDYAVGKRHDLPLINILTKDAAINDDAPAAYRGMDRFVARKQIIADMDAQGLLEKEEKHQLKVPHGDRSGVVIEPFLTDQWYVKMEPLAKPAIEAVETGKIRFVPENWSKTYFQWLNNIEDWCISRQLWWGHRIPAWYDADGKIYVGKDEAAIRAKHGLADDVALTQDNDVLDTWFSSALWPFSTLGWPEQTPELATFYPTDVLVTGFDIIFFWVARMIMMGLKFMGDVPFRDVYITPLIRDAEGQKMSKSKGNALDPIDMIDGIGLEELVAKNTNALMQPKMAAKVEKNTRKQFPEGIDAFGTDALRFTFCSLASPGRDVSFDLQRVSSNRNFCNKLWNAARYVLMNTEGEEIGTDTSKMEFSPADRWIQSRLQHTIAEIHRHFDNYRMDLLCKELYEFTWHEFCDWYLELSKPVLVGDASADQKRGTRYTLVHVLEQLLRLAHPLMPFITEEIWQKVAPLAGVGGDSLMLQAYPQVDAKLIDDEIDAEIQWVKAVITAVRNIRGEMNISPAKGIPLLLQKGDDVDRTRMQNNHDFLLQLAKLDKIEWLDGDAPQSATALVGEMELLIPMAGLIDVAAESARLNKELEKLGKELTKVSTKLANPKFVDKAPEAVVAKEKALASELKQRQQTLQAKLADLAEL